MKIIIFLTLSLFTGSNIIAQYGYVLDPEPVILPDTEFMFETTALPIASSREDVKSVGMGKTQVANGKTFNAMMYNPALLSRSRFSLDVIGIGVSLPPETYDAANYLNDHFEEFKSAVSLKELWAGVQDFKDASTIQQQLNALKRMQNGLRFPRELLGNVIGSPEQPTLHGIRSIPALAVQVGNFGFTLYGVTQSAFQVEQSPVVDALLQVKLPDDMNNPEQVANAIISLEGILQPVLQLNSFDEAMPVTYSISYIDLVGAAGYAFKVIPDLHVGANLKVVHRRFSARRIEYTEFENILNIFKREFNQYVTGFTFDIGGLYKLPFGTEIGLSIQNIIPVKKISSTLTADVTYSYLDYKRDQQGRIQVTNQGDTVVQSNTQTINIGFPFDLELPMVINFGVVHAVTKSWDVAFDIADISEQDFRFENYMERFRIGTEYRLDAIEEKLGVAFRLGMSDKRFTGGIGFNIYKALQLDGAYAYDNYVGTYSYYAQVKIGW